MAACLGGAGRRAVGRGLRSRLKYANVISTLALFLVLAGGSAWAAHRYLITSKRQISPSVLKALKGATGAAGQSGADGCTGGAGDRTGWPGGAGWPSGRAA